MKILVKQGKWGLKDAEGIIIPMREKEPLPKGLPKIAAQLMKDVLAGKEFSGKARQVKHIVIPQAKKNSLRHLVFVGVGKEKALDAKDFGEVIGQAVRLLQAHKISNSALWFRDMLADHFDEVEHLAEIISTYAVMAGYEYSDFVKKKRHRIKSCLVFVENKAEFGVVKEGMRVGAIMAEKINESRDIANHPSNELTPRAMAEFARDAARKDGGLKVSVFGEDKMRKLGMGGVLGVSQGSAQEAQFIIVEYWGADKKEAPYVVAGKGVTFDTGGISIKPSSNMHEMKFDMCGGTAAIAIVRTLAALRIPVNAVALVPASENMPGRDAYKPGDILRAMDGTTIEVLNTDAEGRLLLADALVYAREYKPRAVVDLATLTGACAVALHDSAAGMFTESDELGDQLKAASDKSGDAAWRLPLPARYKDLLRSKVADISNIGSTSYGGAITAAQFLNHFVAKKYPWVHLDIAGMAWANHGKKYLAPGSTGAGIRLVVEWIRQQAA